MENARELGSYFSYSMPAPLNWHIVGQRHEVYRRLRQVIANWTNDFYPNLGLIYSREQIDWLLTQDVINSRQIHTKELPLVDFFIRARYTDDIKRDNNAAAAAVNDQGSLQRDTAVLHAASSITPTWDYDVEASFDDWNLEETYDFYRLAVTKLFEIYTDWSMNYADDEGNTHFHAACQFNLTGVVALFLAYGQDVNCLARRCLRCTPLQVAVAWGHEKVVEVLLRARYCDPNLANMAGMTALHTICMGPDDDASLVELLIDLAKRHTDELWIDVRQHPEAGGDTPLGLALRNNNWAVAEVMLRNGANPNYVDTPLHYAAQQEDVEDDNGLMDLVFEAAEKSNESLVPRVDALDDKGRTALEVALQSNNKRSIESLLRHGADPNLANAYGATPLDIICECREDNHELAKLFFRVNAERKQTVKVNARDNKGHRRTALELALRNENWRVAGVLLGNGADPALVDSPLHHVVRRGHDDEDRLAEFMFDVADRGRQELRVNDRDETGQTALHVAVAKGFKKLTALLLRHRANPNLTNNSRETPLHLISKRDDDVALAKVFFDVCVQLNQRVLLDPLDNEKRTPLHLALAEGCKKKMVCELLKRGADPNAADGSGLTPLHMICERRTDQDGLIDLFFAINNRVGKRVQIDAVDEKGQTPLHVALYNKQRRLLMPLLQAGANPNKADAEGKTPLHWACARDCGNGLTELFLRACQKAGKSVVLNARDARGETPLRIARSMRHRMAYEALLTGGAIDESSITTVGGAGETEARVAQRERRKFLKK